MTRMTPLLERNEQFASTYTPAPLGPPTAQVLIVTCLDHRVDPALTLGLRLGDAPVIRNAGGRVTPAVIDDLAYLGYLAEQLFGSQDADDRLFEVAVVHHTQCGTGLLADPGFRHQAAVATGLPEAALEAAYSVTGCERGWAGMTAVYPGGDEPLIPMPAVSLPALCQAAATLAPSRQPEFFQDIQDISPRLATRRTSSPSATYGYGYVRRVGLEPTTGG